MRCRFDLLLHWRQKTFGLREATITFTARFLSYRQRFRARHDMRDARNLVRLSTSRTRDEVVNDKPCGVEECFDFCCSSPLVCLETSQELSSQDC